MFASSAPGLNPAEDAIFDFFAGDSSAINYIAREPAGTVSSNWVGDRGAGDNGGMGIGDCGGDRGGGDCAFWIGESAVDCGLLRKKLRSAVTEILP